jgi:hypothetical protein
MAIDETYKPATYDTGILRGDSFRQLFNFTAAGLPLDLSGATPRIQFRTKSGDLIDSFAAGSGLTISTNSLIWTISNEQTAGYEPGKYLYDIEITAGGETRTYISGTFTVQKDQTVP